MEYKKVNGVLVNCLTYRNELLGDNKYNVGKYFQVTEQLDPAIGEAYNIRTRRIKSLTDGIGLSEYTNDSVTDYGVSIANKYYNGLTDIVKFTTQGFTDNDFVRWHGKRQDYISLNVSKEGVLNKDLGKDAHILHTGYDTSVTDSKQILGKSIYDNLSLSYSTDTVTFYNNLKSYVNATRTSNGIKFLITPNSFDGINNNGSVTDLVSHYSRLGDGYKYHAGKRWENVYSEADIQTTTYKSVHLDNDANTEFVDYEHKISGKNNLLAKTDKLFNSHRIMTMMGRFHTSDDEGYNDYLESFDSAKIKGWGNPKGRGLLSLKVDNTNGYSNPYCRSWTFHHQYSRVKDMIRPFAKDDDDRDAYNINLKYRARFSSDKNITSGDKYLHENTVLQDTGFVRITPSITEIYGSDGLKIDTNTGQLKFSDGGNKFNSLKKYMFSLENLAWSDGTSNNGRNLSSEQIGPNSGRIMWFPPYNLQFRESVNVKWNQQEFIGRGENIYTYSNTTRKGTLSFTLLIDHPVIVNSIGNGIYSGEEPNLDPEGDMLRFFAGCKIPKPDKVNGDTINGDIRNNANKKSVKSDLQAVVVSTTSPNNTPKVNNTETEDIVFYVFFPNNYSGLFVSSATTTVNEKAYFKNPFDKGDHFEWVYYLLFGRNVSAYAQLNGNNGNIVKNKDFAEAYNTFNGYEMSEKGISNDEYVSEDGTIIGLKDKQKADYNVKNLTSGDNNYQYLVDFDLRQNGLKKDSGGDDYKDLTSSKLNSSLDDIKGMQNGYGKNFSKATHTFSEVFMALLLENSSKVGELNLEKNKDKYLEWLKNNTGTNLDSIDELREIFNKDNIITKVSTEGSASLQDSKNSEELAKRRSYMVNDTLKQLITTKDNDVFSKPTWSLDSCNTAFKDTGYNEKLQPKLDRSVKVTITYKKNKTEQTKTTDKSKVSGEYRLKITGNNSNSDSYGYYGNDNNTNSEIASNTHYETIESLSMDALAALDTNRRRYDDEYRFFRRLVETSPLVHKKIVDKVKYFDPAFHSMSPEGFNARLTFLQQCTRQGHTISASENLTSNYVSATAGNLAFGKMPVCVLRIGDFINTRVIIESMSIDYKNGDQMQWDLNPEGAGVQPMFANVSLNIVLLGGQSLDGPINRLQNAVTFNYYANAPVYDDRADRIVNKYDGTIKYEHLYTPFGDDES